MFDPEDAANGRADRRACEASALMEPFRIDSTAADHVGVLVNPSGDCGPQLIEIEAWARDLGLDVVDLGTSAEPSDIAAGCALVAALGGDGTILRALHVAMPHHAAVLGVNFGTVGFLADIDGDDLARALDRIAAGEATIDARTALVATMRTDPAQRVIAFNDVVVARQPGFGTARLRVEVGGEPMLALSGDGVVVASPTGSTAYTVGAGGPAVAPSLDAIVVTPLATQGSPLRSLVVDGSDRVRIDIEPSSAPLSVEIDGRTTHDMPAAADIEIHAAPRKARLVRTRPRTFYNDLAERLGPIAGAARRGRYETFT
jgi:NAD+ kinase